MLGALILAFNFIGFLKGFLFFVFIVSSLLLMVIILLQEPKGGGLSSAFGGAGAETFGVQAGGVNKFTAWVAGIFLGTAILYAAIKPQEDEGVRARTGPSIPEMSSDDAAPADAEPADDGGGDE